MPENEIACPGMSFKKSPQAMSLSEVEEGRGLQAPAPGVIANGPVSLSSSLPFIPINLTFKVSKACKTFVNLANLTSTKQVTACTLLPSVSSVAPPAVTSCQLCCQLKRTSKGDAASA